MSYQEKKILRDKDGKPIPQVWSEDLQDFVPYTGNVAEVQAIKDDLALIKATLGQVKELLTSGEQKVTLSGNDVVIGLLADRPPASEMRGRGYYAWDETDGHKLKYSDGTNWVVNQ